MKLDGVDEVHADFRAGTVSVAYDLMYITLKDIVETLSTMGYSVHKSMVDRLKNSFIHFSEENEKSNMTASPLPCCSHPDKRL